jgi:hypothetical protein
MHVCVIFVCVYYTHIHMFISNDCHGDICRRTGVHVCVIFVCVCAIYTHICLYTNTFVTGILLFYLKRILRRETCGSTGMHVFVFYAYTIYIYIHTHTHIYIYIYVCIHMRAYVHVPVDRAALWLP